MSKKRKTRQEKKIADLRNQLFQVNKNTHVLPLSASKDSQRIQPQNQPSITLIHLYPTEHIQKDLLKTIYVTAAAIGLQLLLFFLLKHQLFRVPFTY